MSVVHLQKKIQFLLWFSVRVGDWMVLVRFEVGSGCSPLSDPVMSDLLIWHFSGQGAADVSLGGTGVHPLGSLGHHVKPSCGGGVEEK